MNVNLAVPVGSLDAYIHMTNHIPLLSAQEEYTLASRLRQHNDLDAARRLILSHLRFVVRIAKGYSGYGLALGDLIQEGNIGLMKAVKRFDPAVGVRLVTFAMHWIKAEIHEFIIRNWRIVRIATTKAQRKLFFNLRKLRNENLDTQAIAERLDVSSEQVKEMEMRLGGQDTECDPCVADNRYDPMQQLEANEAQPRRQLNTALAALDPRSQDILSRRWLAEKKATLQELANDYHVSAERIRQLEKTAMQKLKSAMETETSPSP